MRLGIPRPLVAPVRVRGVLVATAVIIGASAAAGASSVQAPPVLFSIVDNAYVIESESGADSITFTITLSASTAGEKAVTFNTANGTARAPGDYVALTERVVFPPGTTTRQVSVTSIDDAVWEEHEYFIAYLTDPAGARNARDVGYGTIVDDDPSANPVINTVAGYGERNCCGDGYLALAGAWVAGKGIATDNQGHLYFADEGFELIRRFTLGGTITRYAGYLDLFGTLGCDTGPAFDVDFAGPNGIAVAADGVVYVASPNGHCIQRIGLDGNVTRFAGTGNEGGHGDGGQATSAGLRFPQGIALDPAGNLYIADASNHRIRRVDTNGIITTVAGVGHPGYSGDGGPAVDAEMRFPEGITVAPDGSLLIADTYNHRVRRVDTAGIITTVAGTGQSGHSGDGGPATSVALNHPVSVAINAAGSVFIAEYLNYDIRKVDSAGVITTVVGTGGEPGFEGDGGHPAEALLRGPAAIVLDAAGRLYIVDEGNSRIREVVGL